MYVNPFWFGFGVGFLAAIVIMILFAILRGGDTGDDDGSP